MREFTSIIFMGAGTSSLANCYRLHRRLEEGLIMLGGLQQPDHSESRVQAIMNKHNRRADTLELEEIIIDIVVALGGEDLLNKMKAKKGIKNE